MQFKDSSRVCYHQWELISDNEKSKYEVFLKCKKCGSPQYPEQRVCMKCRAKDQFEEYGFADREAKVTTFSHDNLAVSVDPPVTITTVDFTGGGRIVCDMTDRDPEEVKIGMPLEMTFRKLMYVGGIYNYWWKTRPVRY